jgi:hypothetical protein
MLRITSMYEIPTSCLSRYVWISMIRKLGFEESVTGVAKGFFIHGPNLREELYF